MNGDVFSRLKLASGNQKQALPIKYLNIGKTKLCFRSQKDFQFFVNDFSRFYHVEKNSFTGVFPTELGRFSQVRSFNAASNNLEGTLPPEIGDLTELFNFDLGEIVVRNNILCNK